MQGKLCYPCAIIHNQHCPYEGKQKRRRVYPAPLGTLFSSRESAALILLMPFRIAAECQATLPEVFLFADVAFDGSAVEEGADIEE